MNKIILVIYAVLAVAKGNVVYETGNNIEEQNSIISRSDNFINLNRLQHSKTLEDYAIKLEHFEKQYSTRTEAIYTLLEMMIDSIVQTEQRLHPLEVLSDLSKQCVIQYGVTIPTVTKTKSDVTRCAVEASSQVTSLLSGPIRTRNNLLSYFADHFEKRISGCNTEYTNSVSNYTSCIISVSSSANDYTINNQKTFENLMDAAECIAKANIKKALDCSYTVQTFTIKRITEANFMIDECMDPNQKCKPCQEGFTCSHSYNLQADYESEQMPNPFYGRTDITNCLMLNVK